MKILKSASKIVFIMMAIGLNAALFTGKIDGGQYLTMVGMAFAFYFSHKGEANKPYAGK